MRNLTEKQYRDRIRIAKLELLDEVKKELEFKFELKSVNTLMYQNINEYNLDLGEFLIYINEKRKQLTLDKKDD